VRLGYLPAAGQFISKVIHNQSAYPTQDKVKYQINHARIIIYSGTGFGYEFTNHRSVNGFWSG
jgi:hypothetical protein